MAVCDPQIGSSFVTEAPKPGLSVVASEKNLTQRKFVVERIGSGILVPQ